MILAWPDLGLAALAVIIGIVLIVRGGLFASPAGSFVGWIARREQTAPRAVA